ncbi:MAG: SDR family oxidoreductase [Thermoanaerobaculia bacterium]|nr:SDR family oxidoreductase [Thermoanaerobaculia bacterium]
MNYLILGASGGLGTALAHRLADGGHELFLASRDADAVEALADDVGALHRPTRGADFEDVDALAREAVEELGELHGAVNCAGSLLLKPAHLTTQDELRNVLDANLTTSFALVRAFTRAVRQGPASMVLVSSAVATTGLSNHEAIAAAKGGVAALARSAAATYASRQIRVNAVAPGLVETGLTERLLSNDKAREASLALHPLSRFGSAGEVAQLIAYLLGESSSWMTGQVLHIDGGLATLKTRAS